MKPLSEFDVILLDLNGTFMFGHDRFGTGEDYFATYRALGGTQLRHYEVQEAMVSCLSALLAEYDKPSRFNDFPSLPEAFREYAAVAEQDVELLARVFAAHEIGHVPAAHADWIRRTAQSHKLGIVSNICASPEPWLEYLRQIALLGAFTCTVFSSEGRSIKPSQAIFDRALAHFPADSRVLFVGDSLQRDMIPANAMGWGTAWIAPAGSSHAAAHRVVESLVELE